MKLLKCLVLTLVAVALMLPTSLATADSWDTYDVCPKFFTYIYVEVPVELEDWDSLAELREFVEEHNDEVVVQAQAGKDGVTQFSGQCVGFAMGWRDLAVEYGRNMEICNVSPYEYRRVFNKYPSGGRINHHAVIMAIVDYSLYYMEPENGEIRLASHIP